MLAALMAHDAEMAAVGITTVSTLSMLGKGTSIRKVPARLNWLLPRLMLDGRRRYFAQNIFCICAPKLRGGDAGDIRFGLTQRRVCA